MLSWDKFTPSFQNSLESFKTLRSNGIPPSRSAGFGIPENDDWQQWEKQMSQQKHNPLENERMSHFKKDISSPPTINSQGMCSFSGGLTSVSNFRSCFFWIKTWMIGCLGDFVRDDKHVCNIKPSASGKSFGCQVGASWAEESPEKFSIGHLVTINRLW